MAKVITSREEVESRDGDQIVDACEKLGVPFGCYNGNCGSCRIEVLEGMENLTEKTEVEHMHNLKSHERLACQCILKHGSIKIDDKDLYF